MRLLHQRLGDDCGCAAEEESEGDGCRAARRPRGAQVPLRNAPRDPARHQARAVEPGIGGAMDRREFFKSSGALVVSFGVPSFEALAQAAGKPALVPDELDSWIAGLPNGRVNAFFGNMDMGQGLDVAVAQGVTRERD